MTKCDDPKMYFESVGDLIITPPEEDNQNDRCVQVGWKLNPENGEYVKHCEYHMPSEEERRNFSKKGEVVEKCVECYFPDDDFIKKELENDKA